MVTIFLDAEVDTRQVGMTLAVPEHVTPYPDLVWAYLVGAQDRLAADTGCRIRDIRWEVVPDGSG